MRGFQRTKGLSQQREHEGKHADHVGKKAGQNKVGVPPEDGFYFRAQKDLAGINLGVYFLIECIFKAGIAKSLKFSVCIKSCIGHSVPQYISYTYLNIVQCASRLFSGNTLSRVSVLSCEKRRKRSGLLTTKSGHQDIYWRDTLRRNADQDSEDARTDRKQRNHHSNHACFTFCGVGIPFCRFDITLCRIFFHAAHFNFDICTKAFKSSIHSLKRCFRLSMIGLHTFLQYGNSFLKLASVRRVIYACIVSLESLFVKRRSRLTDRCYHALRASVLVTSLTSATMVLSAPVPAPNSAEAWLDQVERTFVQSSGHEITINFNGDTKTGIFYAPLAQFWVLNGHDVSEVAYLHRREGTLQFRFPDMFWVVAKGQFSAAVSEASASPSALALFHDKLLTQPLVAELAGIPVGSLFHPPLLGSSTGLIQIPQETPSAQRAMIWTSSGDKIHITRRDGVMVTLHWTVVDAALTEEDQ